MAKNKKFLIFILILAALLRLVNLSSGDPLGDEMLYAFRAIGPMDFDVANNQTTPWEWFDQNQSNPSGSSGHAPGVPWWARLSWHDHPPLVFWIQHIFIKLFGENNLAFRLPSAILGVASVYLIYLIGLRLFSEKVGLVSALLLAITVNHVFISRVGLQESYVIFSILLSFLFFLKSLSDRRGLVWVGLAVGLSGLVKYTTLIVVPVFVVYLLMYNRAYFKDKNFWLGILLAVIIFSPVVIYNIGLYSRVGHFDFQFSYMLNQHPKEWPVALGKEEIGSVGDRIKNFAPGLINSNSYAMLLLFTAGLTLSKPRNKFLFVWLFGQILLFLLIGPTRRFLTMLTPVMVLIASNFISRPRYKYILIPIIIFELLYSINSQIFYYPWGQAVWAYSPVRGENYNWGYNKLEDYLVRELKNKYPKYIFDSKFKFIENFQSGSVKQAKEKGDSSYSALIIYDESIYETAQLWLLDRRQIYHGWPVIKTKDYLTLSEKNVFETSYLIMPTDKVPLRPKVVSHGLALESDLIKQGLKPVLIKNNQAEVIFKIYKFSL